MNLLHLKLSLAKNSSGTAAAASLAAQYIRDWIYSAEVLDMCVWLLFFLSFSLFLCYVGHYFIIVRDGAEKN